MTVTLIAPATRNEPALRLRPWRPDDLPALVTAHRDPVLRHRLTHWLPDEAAARQWLDAQAAGWATAQRLSFAVITDPDDGPPIGHIALKCGGAGAAEVGYWTAADARGHGVAARALATVTRWALGSQALVPLARVELLHAGDNRASCRVAEKCGYRLHDLLPPAPPAFPTSGHRHVRTIP